MFDEYFNHPPRVVSLVPAAVAPRPADLTGSPSSTSIDQAAPSASTSSIIQKTQSPIILKVLKNNYKQHNLLMIPFSIFLLHNQVLKNHHQMCNQTTHLLNTSANNFKEALLESSWIDVMQEEIHKFKRLDVWELVPFPDLAMIIKLKWIFKVKQDGNGYLRKGQKRREHDYLPDGCQDSFIKLRAT
ncbi:hypothetical protein Tco_0918472 [Tanacetum coccineum]